MRKGREKENMRGAADAVAPSATGITRRSAVFAAPGILAASGAALAAVGDSPTALENRKPGTPAWQLKHYDFDRAGGSGLRSPRLEGYCSDTSVYPGEKIAFHISTDPPRKFTIDFYRSGYYGGTGGRHMHRIGPIEGKAQPVPMMGMERARECGWEAAGELNIPAGWPSGVYLGKMSLADEPVQSYVIFIVKSNRPADLLFQCADLTWQAYNKWPGWDSLYDDGTPKSSNGYSYTGPNVRVSFDRPYAQYGQVHEVAQSLGSGSYLLWEHPLAFWLEQHGYDVNYCSNLDVDRYPDILKRCKVFLSVGHDEYWTRGMYDNVTAARDRGVSLAFLSGNSVFHQIVAYNNSATAKPLRTFARDHQFEDEHLLLGATSYGTGYGDWVVRKADHWLFEGTGMKNGDAIEGLVGWEFHGPPLAEIPGLEVVAASDLSPFSKRWSDGKFASTIYPGPRRNWVFNAGTIWWSEGLSQPPGHAPASSRLARSYGVDSRVQRITSNFLERALRDSNIRFE